MKRISIGLLFGSLPFILSGVIEGQSSKTTTSSAPSIDKAAPAKVETATLALG